MSDQKRQKESQSNSLFWNRVQLIMIVVVFAAPVVGAYLYKPEKFNNYGDLHTPSKQVENLSMLSDQGNVEFDSFRRQWVFLVFAAGECGEPCENNILKMRQLRFMQNQNMVRIRTVFVHSGLDMEKAKDLSAKYSPIESYTVAENELLSWLQQFRLGDAPEAAQRNRLYVIDPAGNLVISYPADADPSYIKKDIKRLLKVSQIG